MNLFDILQTDSNVMMFFLLYYTILPLALLALCVKLFGGRGSLLRWLYAVPVFLVGHLYFSNFFIGMAMYGPNGEPITRGSVEALLMILGFVSFTLLIMATLVLKIFFRLEGKEYLKGVLTYAAALVLLAGGFYVGLILFGY